MGVRESGSFTFQTSNIRATHVEVIAVCDCLIQQISHFEVTDCRAVSTRTNLTCQVNSARSPLSQYPAHPTGSYSALPSRSYPQTRPKHSSRLQVPEQDTRENHQPHKWMDVFINGRSGLLAWYNVGIIFSSSFFSCHSAVDMLYPCTCSRAVSENLQTRNEHLHGSKSYSRISPARSVPTHEPSYGMLPRPAQAQCPAAQQWWRV